jgi:hypothetical protein
MKKTHTLVVFRNNRVIEQYPFNGSDKSAKLEIKRLAKDVHIGATVVAEKNGVTVGVA